MKGSCLLAWSHRLLADLPLYALVYRTIFPVCVQMLPSRETVQEVIREAQAFWQQHPDEFVAIHCSYGAGDVTFYVPLVSLWKLA